MVSAVSLYQSFLANNLALPLEHHLSLKLAIRIDKPFKPSFILLRIGAACDKRFFPDKYSDSFLQRIYFD